jgi:xanthine/CO dehydrogenase XdhC/CoxF family maturation factor
MAGDGTSLSAILQAADSARALRPLVSLALATLVQVEGSSYRQPGARLLVDAEQRILAGAISGGCLEGDVAVRAAEVCTTRSPVLLRYDLREDLETIWGFGAACDGIAHVLLEPLDDDAWLRCAHTSMLRRKRPVLVTVFGATGDAVTVSHSLIEDPANAEVAQPEHVSTALFTGQPFVGIDGSGNHLLSEPLSAPVALHIIGAGRSAEAFATIASAMAWQVTVIDHREALLHDLRLPPNITRLVRRAEEGLNDLPLDGRSVVALLTHIFQIDCEWLASLLPHPLAYVGVLGSRNRAARLLSQLHGDGVRITPEIQRRLFAPIGLDLGGETPESIALAGVAEMEAVLHERPGGFLRSRQSPIHTRTPIPLMESPGVEADIGSCSRPRNDRA